MKKQAFLFCCFLFYSFCLIAQPKIQLTDYAGGFVRPVDIVHCGDSRLFIVEQDGYIWILDSLGNRLPDVFLDINARVRSTGNEQGLLGLAFPPDYAEKGYFYVHYSREPDGDTRVSRFTRDSLNPDKADPNSELILLIQDQPYANHNGGCIKFGPDGYLYTGLGDGGNANDPLSNGQKKNTFLAKILRIDVSNSNDLQPYTVPADNPFVGNTEYLPEIWSLGWRNPWRFSFDRLTGDMWVGDVGQNLYEEIDFEPANTPGLNYGWRCYEGNHTFNTGGCQGADAYVMPVFEYKHSNANGCSVTGGFIYRGSKYPDLYGYYIFPDYCSGRWWYVKQNANGLFSSGILASLQTFEYSGLGEDRDGELYVALLTQGKIQKIKELCSGFQLSGGVFQQNICTGTFNGIIKVQTSGGAAPVNYIWSNQQPGDQIIYLEAGLYSVTATDANGCVRIDTFEMTNAMPDPPAPVITAPANVLCEGGSMVLSSSEAPAGYTYQWYNGADLVAGANSQTLEIQNGGLYRVKISGSPCSAMSEVFKVENGIAAPPGIEVSDDTLRAITALPLAFQWYLNGQPIPGANANTYIAPESGFYSVEVSDTLGCKAITEQLYVDISSVRLPGSVMGFSLAPNPTSGLILLTMELEKTENIVLSLSDAQQRQIFMQTQQSRLVSLPIDLHVLPAGTYFLTVQLESGRFVRKVVKH
ncbi:MAG: PQQ-dependent sugar dehydrogenase [Saprospiraceae bacterium]|nr:PQQ-dependent sugar dehydrogenase [Saprospiraceae bacterium]